jgi:lysozyme
VEINPKATAAGFVGAFAVAATLIMHFEGYTTSERSDPVGNHEICWGHKGNIKIETKAGCIALLKKDIDNANSVIDKYVKVPITQNQRGELIDFIYNEGGGSFSSSTLLKKLNKGDYAGACSELSNWVYAGDEVFNGLITRRAAEEALCMEGVK